MSHTLHLALVAAVQTSAPDAFTPKGTAARAVTNYFDAWNKRDMDRAVAQFAPDAAYEDTQYAGAFVGREALEKHLFKVADALPPTFEFCIDEVADGGDVVGVQWHVENDGQPLPFTRGCSMYRADPRTGLLLSGFDVPEPAPFKPGSASLFLLGAASKIIAEPARALPAAAWAAYVPVVFFSDLLPGVPAQSLDPDTWKEVLDLSLNFWLVAPLLNLPIAATVHPGLEAIFNLLLAWAAAFAGFLSDGRPGRPSGSMLPIVAGMQLLTNAFYLPYLVLRSPEKPGELVYREDLAPAEAAVSEWRGLGPLLATVGTTAIAWGVVARPEYGDLATRLGSLTELLSHDRVGFSFVVDLGLFALFQGWLVDDDLRRRGTDPDAAPLASVARFVPFYGLCAYLAFRPALPSKAGADADPSRP